MKKINNDLLVKKVQSFLRKNVIFVVLIVVLLLGSFVIWKREKNKEVTLPASLVVPVENKPNKSQGSEEIILQLKADTDTLLQRIMTLEQHTQSPQVPINKIIEVELLRGVLEGNLHLNSLKTYLSKISDSWAQAHLSIIVPMEQCLTYQKLDLLLNNPPTVPPPSEGLTLWESIQSKFLSMISVRQVDSKGVYRNGLLEDIHKELRNHDIKKAIVAFQNLPETERQNLSTWIQLAVDRRNIEDLLNQVLIDLSIGGAP